MSIVLKQLPVIESQVGAPPDVVLSDSTYIASGAATSTTQRLTGLTGTFAAGRISDDTNPLPSINIGADGNTEVEFCVKLRAGLANGAQYKFRITANGVPLDTYSVTPVVTVGAAAQEPPFATRLHHQVPDPDLAYAAREWRVVEEGVFPGLREGEGGDLQATAAIAFTASGALQGRGALTAQGALLFSCTPTLQGRGAVQTVTTVTFPTTAVIEGRGALASTSSIAITPTAVLSGRGALAATGGLAFQLSSTLQGRGALASAPTVSFAATATFGGGAFGATAEVTFTQVSSLQGKGVVVPSGGLSYQATAALSGRGQLAPTGGVSLQSAATLQGRAALSSSAALTFGLSATLEGLPSGGLSATSSFSFNLVAVLSGIGEPLPTVVGGSGRPVRRKREKSIIEVARELFSEEAFKETLEETREETPTPHKASPTRIDVSDIADIITPRPKPTPLVHARKPLVDKDEDDDDLLLLS